MFKKTRNVWIFILIVLIGISAIQWYLLNESQSEEKINNEIEWSLSAFLEYYNSWSFEKIEVINDKDLAWYILLSETEKQKEYDVFKSEKPENTSLSDIWIEVLWKSNIIVKTEEESILKSMVKEGYITKNEMKKA